MVLVALDKALEELGLGKRSGFYLRLNGSMFTAIQLIDG
jgi:hypothetical protein